MSPLELIERGIREGNWEVICNGYKLLTGKALSPPKVHQFEEVLALQKIIAIAQKAVGCVGEFPQTETVLHSTKKKKRGRPKKKSIGTDDGEDTSIQLDDDKKTIIQKTTGKTQLITNDPDPEEIEKNKIKAVKSQQNKVKLNRKATQIYRVKCNECEEEFDSDRPDGELGHKCKKCLRDKKSRFSS